MVGSGWRIEVISEGSWLVKCTCAGFGSWLCVKGNMWKFLEVTSESSADNNTKIITSNYKTLHRRLVVNIVWKP